MSIPPQKCFVEKVGGERVHVSVLLAPGQSPHTYEPTPKQIVSLSKARVYFRIGVPFEKQVVAKIGEAIKGFNIVDTCQGIRQRAMTAEEIAAEIHEATSTGHHDEEGHSRDNDHKSHHHDEGELDPHVWMNPRLVKIQAGNIRDELIRLDPDHRNEYELNCRAFEKELDLLDARIMASLASLHGREFFVFHPGFGYFADAYGLKQVAVETGGKQPTAKQLGELIERARRAGVKLIFV